jgi:hypothetical protein
MKKKKKNRTGLAMQKKKEEEKEPSLCKEHDRAYDPYLLSKKQSHWRVLQ